VKGILKNTAIKYFIREIISLSMSVRPKMAANVFAVCFRPLLKPLSTEMFK
jgi:hypothetical protein